jgi:hypothetical protein
MGGYLDPPSSLDSTIMHSVVIIKEATEEESSKDLLTTLAGSMIPASTILTYSSMAALYPISSS